MKKISSALLLSIISHKASEAPKTHNPYFHPTLLLTLMYQKALSPSPQIPLCVETLEQQEKRLSDYLFLAGFKTSEDKGESQYRKVLSEASVNPHLSELQAIALKGIGNITKEKEYFEKALELDISSKTRHDLWVCMSNYYGSQRNNIMRMICLYRAHQFYPQKKLHLFHIFNKYRHWLILDLQSNQEIPEELKMEFNEARAFFKIPG